MPSVLVVDDELAIRESFSLILADKYHLLLAASGEAALKIAADQRVDLAFLDVRMPGLNGLETLRRLKQLSPELEVVMVTAVNDVQSASEAVRHGARDYVVKPFDIGHITKLAEQILRRKALLQEGSELRKLAGWRAPRLIGQSDGIQAALQIIAGLKEGQRVLVVGEPGTEKETVARLVHEQSGRPAEPFHAYYLSPSLTGSQLSAALFGSERGETVLELTGQAGLLEKTGQGTLFLDNLGALPAEVQAVLTRGEFVRQGGTTPLPLQSRLIGGVASLADLTGETRSFFAEAVIKLPPLRERPGDIPLLIDHFIDRYGQLTGKTGKLDAALREALVNYDWPGNTRQLANVVQRLMLNPDPASLDLTTLPFELLLEGGDPLGQNFVEELENGYIQDVLAQNGQDLERAAALLDIKPTALAERLKPAAR